MVVATPIGNLADISQRALQVLSAADLILAEDTRHSKRLLNHYGISAKLRSCHEHNEAQLIEFVQRRLGRGETIALISDAGTPLISDPGFVLVRALRKQGFEVQSVPGPSSIIAALSVAGLATDRFVFDGFLPPRRAARQSRLQTYANEVRTVVLLESSHRIIDSVNDIASVLGPEKRLVIARELTKKFETVLDASAGELQLIMQQDPDQSRGEFVLMLEGTSAKPASVEDSEATLSVLLDELPLKQAVKLAARITGQARNDVYKLALRLKQ